MSETDRDAKSGRFLPGNSGFGGRPKGSRNRLGEAFVQDLHAAWEQHGVAALEECAQADPARFCAIVAGLLPRDVNLSVGTVDVAEFADRFRAAVEMLGNEPPPKLLRRSLRVINHGR